MNEPLPRRITVSLPLADAEKLAYYNAANGAGVLAPRGWHCFGTYGSSGTALFVVDVPIDPDRLFRDGKGFDGPAVVVLDQSGGTSGRFSVAEIAARVFPAYKSFVDRVRKEGIGGPLPTGPWPADKLVYKGKSIVEYTTPPRSSGLGTTSSLIQNDSPIQGVAILTGPDTDLVLVEVRLPPALTGLTAAIVGQLEREFAPAH